MFFFHLIYNLTPITATIVCLAKFDLHTCYYPIYVFPIGLIVKNVWRFALHTYKFKVSRSWARAQGTAEEQELRALNDIMCLGRWDRVDRFVDFLIMCWFIFGSFMIFRESQCATFDDPIFTLGFSLLIIVWVEFLAPCLLICLLVPFVCCCPIVLFRILSAFSVQVEGAQRGAKEEDVQKLPVETYERVLGADVQCSICLSDLETGDEVRVLPCAGHHTYHKECIDQWLTINGICCVCREPIFDNHPAARENARPPQQQHDQNQRGVQLPVAH